MSYLVIEGFGGGLDARKFRLAAPAGTLTTAINGHVTPGAEIEKRKAFVRVENPTETTSLPAGTFGLCATSAGLVVFGSADLAAEDYPAGFSYQRLQHPAVLAGETYSAGSHAMTGVVWSEVYSGLAFVLAQFADGRTFAYFDGDLVEDYVAGLILPYLAGDNVKIATAIKNLVEALPDYSASLVSVNVAGAANNGGGKVRLTLAVATTIPTGTTVRVASVGGTVEANGLWTATFVDTTHIDLLAVTFVNAWTAGGTVTSAMVDVTGPLGVEFEVDPTPTSTAGTFGAPSNTVAPVMPVDGTPATGYFKIVAGTQAAGAATAAAGSVVGNTTPAAGEYVIVGNKKYTFRATPTIEGEVKINGTSGSITNLQRAINRTGGTPGTDYVIAKRHPYVTASAVTGAGPYTIPLTAAKGLAGVASSVSGTIAAWTYNTFTGGTGNCVSSVKVIDLTGTETELLSAAIDWNSTNDITAGLVASNINANTAAGLTHGFTAVADGNQVNLYSPLASATAKNNWRVQVVAGGNVCIGACMWYLVQLLTPAGLNSIRADGQDLVTAGTPYVTYPSAGTLDSLDELYAKIVQDINARSLISGFVAYATATYVQVSRITTRSDDIDTALYVTPSSAPTPTFGVKFGEPPANPQAMEVKVPDVVFNVVDVVDGFNVPGQWFYLTVSAGTAYLGQSVVTAEASGGSGLYTYSWRAAYAGSNTAYLSVVPGGGSPIQVIIEPVATNKQSTLFRLRALSSSSIVQGPSVQVGGLFVCEVSDGVNTVVSEPVSVQFILG